MSDRWLRTVSRRLGGLAAVAFLAGLPSEAEVVFDGSLGRKGAADSTNAFGKTNFRIEAADGQTRGSNLFHSFLRLNLSDSETAAFAGPDSVRNILARVTGGSASSINGLLASEIQGANLFLINPAGIVFGSNASINVTGSFFATTADYIKLGNDGSFAATANPADSILSVSDPSAFGFLTPNPAAIRVRSASLAQPGIKTVGLVAGNVAVDGGANIQAEDFQIHSVRSAGEASLQLANATNGLRYPAIGAGNFSQRGAVTIGNSVPAGDPPAPPASVTANRVVIRGGSLVMTGAQVITQPATPGDGISLHLSGALTVNSGSALLALPVGDLTGTAAIEIAAGEATLNTGSAVGSLTSMPGIGGDVRLSVSGALRVVDSAAIVAASFSSPRGGDIAISAGSIELARNSVIASQGDTQGRAGDIFLNATGTISLMDASSVSLSLQGARGERILLNADQINISGRGSGFIYTDFFPEGVGGSITLNARGKLTILDAGIVSAFTFGRDGASILVNAGSALISGAGVSSDFNTGITAESSSGAGGQGGLVALNISGSLDVLEGGVISTNALGEGPGGDIQIAAYDVTVTGRGGEVAGLLEQSRGITAQNRSSDPAFINGPSGNIRLALSGTLLVRDAGEILVDTIGSGPGGSIEIAAHDLSIATKGTISARTAADVNAGAGGDVSIDVSDRLQVEAGGLISASTLGAGAGGTVVIRGNDVSVSGRDARISAVSGGPGDPATGRGGDVSIRTTNLNITNDGQITASTYGTGAGGGIQVAAKTLRVNDSDSEIFAGISAQTLASATGGDGGQVRIDAQTLMMRGEGAAITTQSSGSGQSGHIQIDTVSIAMSDGSTIQSSSIGAGAAGSLTINAEGEVSLLSGSSLSVDAAQSNAGNIRVRVGERITLTDASITAQAALDGGNIDLRASDLIHLVNGEITAAAGVNGGNIFIDPAFVVLDRSLISANAIVGRGGNIRIISDFFFASPDSLVTATSQLGIDGTVTIDALNNDVNDSLIELPSQLIDAESLLRELCTMKIENFSSFVSEGRGGLPPLPGEAVPSLMIVQ